MNITTYTELIDDISSNRISMVPKGSFDIILKNFKDIDDIKGDIVECGCWRGGFSIFMSHVFSDKNIWVCDSFGGFQPLNHAKYEYATERHIPEYTHNAEGPIAISLDDVKNNFKTYGLSESTRIQFLKGFVKDTLNPDICPIQNVALLRIDVDAYSATLEVLESLYHKVSDGGYIIFDDSGLIETYHAIQHFFKTNDIPPYLYHDKFEGKLEFGKRYSKDESGLPQNCYFIKNRK